MLSLFLIVITRKGSAFWLSLMMVMLFYGILSQLPTPTAHALSSPPQADAPAIVGSSEATPAVTHTLALQPIGQVAGDYSVVVVSGTLAYLGGNNGLTIFEISQPTQPVTLTHLATAQPIQDLKVVSNWVYLAQGIYDPYRYPVTGTMQIVDVQNPMTPVIRSSVAMSPEAPVALDVVGPYAYVGASYAGPLFQQSTLYVWDIRRPEQPTLNQHLFQFDASIGGIAHANHGLYLARYVAGGLDLLDLSRPATPTLTSHITTEAEAVAALNQQLYVASSDGFGEPTGGFQGLQIFNVADLAAPVRLGRFHTPQRPTGVLVNDNQAYVTEGNFLQVLDVTTSAAPRLLGETSLTGLATAHGLQVQGDLVFVVTQPNGLRILRAVEPAPLVRKSFLPLMSR